MGQISCRLASSVHFLPVAAGLLESSTLFVSVICISMHQEFWYRGSSLISCEGSGYISVIACPLTFHLLHNFTWILLIHLEMMLFFKHFLFVKGSWNNFYCKTYFEEQNIIPICSCFYLTAWHLYGWLPLVLNVNPWTKYKFFWLGEGIYCYKVLINFTVKKCRQFWIRSFYLLNLEYFALYYKTSDLKIVVVLESYLQMNTCNNFSK